LLDKAQIVQDMVREGATIEEINERVSPGEPNGLVDAFVVEQPMLEVKVKGLVTSLDTLLE